MSHTPGPWVVVETDEGHEILMGSALPIPRSSWAVQHRIEYEHLLDPDADHEVERAQYLEADANARLIAAAPDLKAALEDAHDALGELMSGPFVQIDWGDLAGYLGNDAWIGLKERIDAALAKATGEAST